MNSLLLVSSLILGISHAQQLDVTPGRTIAARGSQLDPDNDGWWVDAHNKLSFHSLIQLQKMPCDPENVYQTRFRYYNNAGQVYVRMTPEYIFTEFWYPFQFWSGYATTAQIFSNGEGNRCYQCIASEGYTQPELYNFKQRRIESPNNNCWDECIGNNTFLNTGDTDQDPIFSWTFFEAEIYHDLSLSGQPPEAYRLPVSNDVDLEVSHTFNRSLEIVLVSNATGYSYLTGELINFGDMQVPYVHGAWFREWRNPSNNEWVSPFRFNPPMPNPFNRNLRNGTCFTWIASKDEITGKFGTLNEQYFVNEAGIACPNMIECRTTSAPTTHPTSAPVPIRSTVGPTPRTLPPINFEATPCHTCSMDLFILIDASKSITDSGLERQKLFVKQLLSDIKAEFDRVNFQMALMGYPDRLCFRPGLITFSHVVATPMPISMWDCTTGGYNPIIGDALIDATGRPHLPNTRLAGTHIRDALEAAVVMHNNSYHNCTSFYGIALTDGEPQSVSSGPNTNQDPCLFPAFGAKLRNMLTDFFWVPVERDPPFNTELFSCLRKGEFLVPVTASVTVNLSNCNTTAESDCEMCKNPTQSPTNSPTRIPTKLPTFPPTRTPSNNPTIRPSRNPTSVPSNNPTRTPTKKPTKNPTIMPTKSPTTRKPTMWPTMSPTVCIPPPLDEIYTNCECDAETAEWKLELKDYKFDEHKDRTYVQYEVCVYARNPFVSCNNNGLPVALQQLFLQIPCNCDLCVDFVTKDMDPDGLTTELERGWIWNFEVEPGECQSFELAVKGHATLKPGFYHLLGADERCVNDLILVPDVCEDIRPEPSHHWHWESHEEPENEECEPHEPLFLKKMCWNACDAVEQTEWLIEYESLSYDTTADITTVMWRVSTSNTLPTPSCNLFDDNPAPLNDVTIRLGCDCEPQSESYLRSITLHTTPPAVVHSNFWHFDNLNIRAGESTRLIIVLKGQISLKENGDVTLGGSYRCGSTLMAINPTGVVVPNPCSDPCNFGQWTDWELRDSCSLECGGGKQARVRKCVSICNSTRLVDNCPGEAHGTVPCNTEPCPIWMERW